MDALLAARRDGEKVNAGNNLHADAVTFAKNTANTAREALEEAEKQLEAWTHIAEVNRKTLQEKRAHVATLEDQHMPKDVDLTAIDFQIAGAEKANQKLRENNEQVTAARTVASRQANANHLTETLNNFDKRKDHAIRKAALPLPGLTFDDAGVLFNGLPFKQSSSGEQLRVSVAVGMALNPKLRVIFIRDGSLLDVAGLKLVAEMAAANNFQVWMEDARSADPAAIVIEDGHVKGAAE